MYILNTKIKYSDVIDNKYFKRFGIDPDVTDDKIKNINTLVENIFCKINIPVIILMGLSTPKLEKVVNLNLSKYHITGQAIDFTLENTLTDDLKYLFIEMVNELKFTELFFIESGNYDYIHVAFDKNNLKEDVAFRKKTQKQLTHISDLDVFFKEFNLYKPTQIQQQPEEEADV